MSKKKPSFKSTSKEQEMLTGNQVETVQESVTTDEMIEQAIASSEIRSAPSIEVPVEPVAEVIAEPVAEPVVEQQKPIEPEPVVIKKTEPVKKADKSVVQDSDFEIEINIIRETGTARQKYLIETIESYMSAMSPGKPIDNDKGAKQQYNLWKFISNIVEKSTNEEFGKLWNIILAYFNKYSTGVFSDRYIYRFSEYWVWSTSELSSLQKIINLLQLTCDKNKRNSNLSKVDINKTMSSDFSEEARQRIISFYKK